MSDYVVVKCAKCSMVRPHGTEVSPQVVCALGGVCEWDFVAARKRPSLEEVMMRFAFSVAERSTCLRLRVGCVIATPDLRHILAFGYNGNAHGLPNQCDSAEPGNCGDVHAEMNAVIKSPPDVPKVAFCTDSPCVACAKALIQVGGVQRVLYSRVYRRPEGRDVLSAGGIAHSQFLVDP